MKDIKTPAGIMKPGTIARYRKVGKAEVIAHSCEGIGYDCLAYNGAGGSHRYQVRFITGPRSYKEGDHQVWLRAGSEVPERVQVWQSPSGRLHWLQGCTSAGPRSNMRRVTIDRCPWDPDKHCRCLRHKLEQDTTR